MIGIGLGLRLGEKFVPTTVNVSFSVLHKEEVSAAKTAEILILFFIWHVTAASS